MLYTSRLVPSDLSVFDIGFEQKLWSTVGCAGEGWTGLQKQ